MSLCCVGKKKDERSYRIQLAEDNSFETIIHDVELKESVLKLSMLSGGRYYMRMSVIGMDGYQGDFSETQIINIPYDYYWYLLWLLLIPLFILI